MKTLFFILFLSANVVFAQNEYKQILERGKEALKKEDYRTAILKYRAAEAADPSKKEEVNALIDAVFVAIEKKRQEAEEAKLRAEKAEKQASLQTEKAQRASVETIKALKEAEIAKKEAIGEKETAKTALAKAQKLVDAFYFYENRFALAYGKIGDYNKFYFIDKNGDKVEKLGEWNKAEQFEYNGFAKVKKEQVLDYLIDTLGNAYQVAYQTKDLSTEIKALDLRGTYLDSFPVQVLQFPDLEVLILNATYTISPNSLRTLPTEIQGLSKLKVLQLQSCHLDSLPPQIGELKNLTTLDLSYNKFTELPPQIGELKNLSVLSLKQNRFMSLPAQIGELKNLSVLDLRENQLSSLPAQIGELKNLSVLSLYYNPLTSLPAQIGELTNLRELDLTSDLLTSLPAQIGELKNLSSLNLDNNPLTSLPPQIGELKNLRELNLGQNEFTSLPTEIGELKNLSSLNLMGSKLRDLPAQIGELKNLRLLDLSGNNSWDWQNVFTVLSKLPQKILFTLDWHKEKQEGILWVRIDEKQVFKVLEKAEPSQIEGWKNLSSLNLMDSKLRDLSAQIGELKNLRLLYLGFNDSLDWQNVFTVLSKLPQKILFTLEEKSPAKDTLWVRIDGKQVFKVLEKPSQIGELKNLSSLNLMDSKLRDLPAQIGELKNLSSLKLGDNDSWDWQNVSKVLSKLPQKALFTLDWHKEKQEGILWVIIDQKQVIWVLEKAEPSQIEELINLSGLNLMDSKLTSLPAEIGELKNLSELYLSSNQLTSLPAQIGELRNLTMLLLNNNPLSVEEINKSLRLLPSLEALYLGDLGLSALPDAVLGLTNLKTLRLNNYGDKNPNTFSEAEKEKIRKLLPNCEVVF